MKKLLFIVPLLGILFTGCKGDDGKDGVATWHTITVNVKASEWILKGNPGELGSYYYVEVGVPEITQSKFNGSAILAYIQTDPQIKTGLPYVQLRGDVVGGVEKLWTEEFKVEFWLGGAEFRMTSSDFETNFNPGDQTFYIML